MKSVRDLPSVDALLSDERVQAVVDAHGREHALAAARAALERAREELLAGHDPGDLAERVEAEASARLAPRLRRVLNATGVVLHTNLGRAPLAPAALERLQ